MRDKEMDHQAAIQSQSVEKYLLGTLDGPSREAFEEHFFGCAVCAEEIRSGVSFMDNAAAEFESSRLSTVVHPRVQPAQPSNTRKWALWNWVGPVWAAVPTFALALLSVLWVRDHRQMQGELAAWDSVQPVISVPADASRGERTVAVSRQNRFFAVTFFIDSTPLPSYSVEISGENAAPVELVMPAVARDHAYQILLPTSKYHEGHYQVAIKGGPGTNVPLIQQFSLYLK